MGSGRSGTTWFASLLASPFRYRLLFEPFHPGHVPGAEMIADHYFWPNEMPLEVIRFIDNALNDRINSKWIAQHSNRRFNMHRWRLWPKARIIKIIRGNLLIPALRSLYGKKLPIIHLVRHPAAVVDSFLRVKFPWGFDLSTLSAQKVFAADYRIPLDLLIEQAIDPVSIITVRWLIENLYLFTYAKELGVKTIYYEDVINNPVESITRLCAETGLEVYEDLARKAENPSATTHPRSQIRKGEKNTHSWQNNLPQESIARIEAILKSVDFEYPRN